MAKKEEFEIEAKLRSLKEDFDRNEDLMRKAAMRYEDLVAQKEDLAAAIAELRKAKGERPPRAPESHVRGETLKLPSETT